MYKHFHGLILSLVMCISGCGGEECGPSDCRPSPRSDCLELAELIQRHVKLSMPLEEVRELLADTRYAPSNASPYVQTSLHERGPFVDFQRVNAYDENPDVYLVDDFNDGAAGCKTLPKY